MEQSDSIKKKALEKLDSIVKFELKRAIDSSMPFDLAPSALDCFSEKEQKEIESNAKALFYLPRLIMYCHNRDIELIDEYLKHLNSINDGKVVSD